MASDKLHRKLRKKLGMDIPKNMKSPNTKPSFSQQSRPIVLSEQPARAKGCCGKSK